MSEHRFENEKDDKNQATTRKQRKIESFAENGSTILPKSCCRVRVSFTEIDQF